MTTATDENNAVLVVGAGIAGMAAALHLVTHGHEVHLLDSAPAIGGAMHLLDHTFPTNSCGICLMLPHQPALCPTLTCDLHPQVHLLPYAELTGLEGQPGRFTATVHHKARYVHAARCTGCGECAAVCPEVRPHDHEGALQPVKAIYRPAGLRAVPDTWLIDMAYCTRCGECVTACPWGAIDLEMQDRTETLQVGAVLLTPGFAAFDARAKGEYGYGVYDNVLSALEFERLVSLAGSSVARLRRPSDGQPPKRVAFIHCVGSRDNLCGAGYCSSACCMYTAKQVALAKALAPELDVTVFYMDLRAFGKEFETYVAGVQALPGVHYRRAMPSAVHQRQQTRELLLTYVGEEGRLQEEAFDLLVLAIGLAPPAGMQTLAGQLGIELNAYGFAQTDGYAPARTSRAGVFVAGAFREPKDIPETVAEAAGAAAEVCACLQGSPAQPVASQATYAPRDVSDEEARVGVFVCECEGELAAVHPAQVAAWAGDLPGVALARVVAQGCAPAGRATIVAAIEEEKLNRVVVAGCSPRLYGDEFEALMRDAGLDPRLLARVNLREQVVYPHRDNGADLAAKARALVGMAVAGLRTLAGVEALAWGSSQALTRRAVVVGGGAAGLSAALELARLDVPVELVERETELGGQWCHIRYQVDGSDPQAALNRLRAQVEAEARITVHLGARVSAFAGQAGRYRTTIVRNGTEQSVEHGVLVVATGGQPARTEEYLYGQDPRVLTQRELEEQIAGGTLATVHTVVMVQCVGSREAPSAATPRARPYCSRVCCTQAVKNALKLKELRPEVEVYVLYREVRTYGFHEAAYQAARDAGVVFLRYELPDKPAVEAKADRLQVRLVEPVAGQEVELKADLVVLSVGLEATTGLGLAKMLGVTLNDDGFFQEEHAKMKPLDLGRTGLYVAGLAHSPRFLTETIAQAQGAAMRAAAFLAKGQLEPQPTAVFVNERLCSFCGLCVEACPYEARVMNYDSRVADVEYALCQGCGVCAMVCPNKATLQKTFEHKQLMAAIDMALI
jgi:heterodisulfide reductase subunit A